MRLVAEQFQGCRLAVLHDGKRGRGNLLTRLQREQHGAVGVAVVLGQQIGAGLNSLRTEITVAMEEKVAVVASRLSMALLMAVSAALTSLSFCQLLAAAESDRFADVIVEPETVICELPVSLKVSVSDDPVRKLTPL